MKRVKGCLNKRCNEYHKTYYKESDEYCVKCGTKLSYVCKHPKCFKQIPDNVKEKYCPVHLAERQDKKEKRGKTALKVGGGLAGIGFSILGGVKLIGDIVKKK